MTGRETLETFGSVRCFLCNWGFTRKPVGLLTIRNEVVSHLEKCVGPIVRLNATGSRASVFLYPDLSEEGWGEIDGWDLEIAREYSYKPLLKKEEHT